MPVRLRATISLALLLVALTFVSFFPALRAGFIWDDQDYVTQNPTLRDVAGLGQIWTNPPANWQYYPLVFTSFWLEYHAWQLAPFGYHLDNIILQAVAAILLWRLLVTLRIAAPWLAAAIFAVHPVQVETVAWITERKNLLCGVFYFAAMLVYFSPRRRWSDAIALGLFIGAMFSKTVAVTFPAAVLVIVWWKNGRIQLRRDVFPLIPFFAIGIGLSLLTARLEAEQVRAVGPEWDLSVADRIIIAGRALWFYPGKAIAPVRLTFIYPRWNVSNVTALQMIFPAAATAMIATLLLLRKKIGRGPGAAALLFAGTLAPALGFVNFYPMRYSFVADHFQYLAIVALIVPFAAILARVGGRWAVVVLAPLVVISSFQSQIYRDSITLWTDTVNKNPESWAAHVNLGSAELSAGRPDLAEPQYRLATDAAPEQSDAWWGLGDFLVSQKRFAEAAPALDRAVQLNPDNADALSDLNHVRRILNR